MSPPSNSSKSVAPSPNLSSSLMSSDVPPSFRDAFLIKLLEIAPDLRPLLESPQGETLVPHELISPFVVEVPKEVLVQAQESVREIFEFRKSEAFQKNLREHPRTFEITEPQNFSILMSYDFHLDSEKKLKLIEINTNASFLAMSWVLYLTRGVPQPISDFRIEEIRENILNEYRLFNNPSKAGTISPQDPLPKLRTAIVDRHPESQRLFIEFLLYQSLFRQWGWDCEILDIEKVSGSFDFIYNRSTDFYFQEPESQNIQSLFLDRKVCISPQPYEYFCLADKERMIDLAKARFQTAASVFLPSVKLSPANQGEIWSDRKQYFLKPLRSFGAKQVYRGESISRRIFDELVNQDILAQKFCSAPEVEVPTTGGTLKFKYDLRFFVYMGRVQSVVARLYQGQVTNLRTPFGGFACVRFI